MPVPKSNWPIKKTTVVLIATVAFIISAAILLPNREIIPTYAAGGEMSVTLEGYWWAPNGGWINLQWDTVGENGVRVDKSSFTGKPFFDGFAWGPNIGWISMRDTSGAGQYGVVVREPINPTPAGGVWHVDNYAWGPNIGWLNFDAIDSGANSAQQPRIVMENLGVPGSEVSEDARLKGYAWSPNIGWIKLDSDLPGWKDTNDPVLKYFDVLPEVMPPLPSEKYASGVYKDSYDCCGGTLNTFAAGHMVWVRPAVEFKATMHSQDNRTRWHDLNISAVTANPQTIPELYLWKDRLRFRPGLEPSSIGNVNAYDAALNEFLPNPDFAAGSNPNVPMTGGEVKVPSEEDINGDGKNEIIWKSTSHFLSGTPGANNYVLREFRYNVRDAGGNYACPDAEPATFDWSTGQGCIIPSLPSPYSPMTGRVGVAVDKIQPSGSLFINDTEFTESETVKVSATAKIDFKVEYIDTESGSYHVILDYRRKAGNAWPLVWSDPIGERRWNLGREAVTWNIDGNIDLGAETEKETPLNTSDWADGQEFQLRLRVIDNVGNVRERILPAVINRTPPTGVFTAADPIDRDPNRTRYDAVDLYLPPSATIKTMQFANTPDGFGSEFEPYPWLNGGWREGHWSLEIVQGEEVTGGLKSIYANFCDGTIPEAVCTHDQNKEIKAQIAAPWFEGAQGDVYAGSGIGTRSAQFNGIAPYLTVGVQKYNATYRITSDGEIKPQITSERGWSEGDYQNFGYPGIGGTIAPIDFESLRLQADIQTDDEIAQAGELDFTQSTNGIILLQSGSSKSDASLGSNGDRLIVRGTGTLLVDGNLRILKDLYYADSLADQPTPEIDSMAVLTRRSSADSRGNVYVGENVRHMVGAYIVGLGNCFQAKCPNDSLGTGVFHSSADFSAGIGTDPNLKASKYELVVEGMVAARDFDLGRYSTGNQNFLTNADLEPSVSEVPKSCLVGWTCDPADPNIFQASDKDVVSGKQKLQISLKPGQKGNLLQSNIFINLQGESTLSLSGYLRSTIAGLPVPQTIDLAIGGQTCTLQPSDIDSQWRRFQCSVKVLGEAKSIDLRITAINFLKEDGFTLDLDALQLEAGNEATEWHNKFEGDTNYMASERFYYDGRVILNTPPGLASLTSPAWGETIAD